MVGVPHCSQHRKFDMNDIVHDVFETNKRFNHCACHDWESPVLSEVGASMGYNHCCPFYAACVSEPRNRRQELLCILMFMMLY